MAIRQRPMRRKILVAEDNEVNLLLVTEYLRTAEHQVVVARNGKEAVALTQAERPELVLMDLRMPVMDGLEATRCLRAMEEFRHLPIIALSADVEQDDVAECMEAGCSAHLGKPIDRNELHAVLERFLGGQEARD